MLVIYRDAKRRGIYLALWTDPEGDSCFSIYQISLFEFVYVRFNWQYFGDHFFLRFCCKFSEKIFFHRPVNSDKPNFVSYLVFFGTATSVTAKISSFETVAKREAILNPVAKQWISKDIPSYGSQSECSKIPIHWFGEC